LKKGLWDSFKNDAESFFNKMDSSTVKLFNTLIGDFNSFVQTMGTVFAAIKDGGIMDVLNCAVKSGQWALGIVSVITGIDAKIVAITAALAAGGAPVVIPFAEIAVSLICDWNKFKNAANFLANAIESNNSSTLWSNLGNFFGTLSNIIATA